MGEADGGREGADCALEGERGKLFDKYRPWALRIAFNFADRRGLLTDLADYRNAALYGLYDACRRFDATLGFEFKTLAHTRVCGEVWDEARRKDWVPKSARHRQRDEGERLPAVTSIDKANSDGRTRALQVRSGGPGPAESAELRDEVERVVRAMPHDGALGKVLRMHFFEDMNFREIAKVLGKSPSRIGQMYEQAMLITRRRLWRSRR